MFFAGLGLWSILAFGPCFATVRSRFWIPVKWVMDDELRSWQSSDLMHFRCMSWIMLVDWHDGPLDKELLVKRPVLSSSLNVDSKVTVADSNSTTCNSTTPVYSQLNKRPYAQATCVHQKSANAIRGPGLFPDQPSVVSSADWNWAKARRRRI
ncbi:hypothetical protein Nepgr_023019 [Nepenthes gracilis]|uniref:Secreted protein n=1 Tax=Nepenthes gracilis TaxID=150966 RepID=A0AAD3XXC3_NEPGR|nr:hypothetical protein Nepgr_023019 [Nepenthes gracilis]